MSLADVFELFVDRQAPVALRAYDGSVIRCEGAVGTVVVRAPRALRYLATAPGELGLARAYVVGDIDVLGDLHGTLTALLRHRREQIHWREIARSLRPWMLRRPPLPAEESPPRWRRGPVRHTKARDARAIAHHYDLSNHFYELVLGRSMAYSCAVFDRPRTTLQEAQQEKFDLVCRKLGLKPGERLLDVGAGWGGLVRHAAEHYGVRALGVTLSRPQAEWASRSIQDAGLGQQAEVRLLDYRDIREHDFDAVSSVGVMEHIGTAQLKGHFRAMVGRLRPEGRMLNHAISRPSEQYRHRTGPFIDRYVFPDGELQSPGTTMAAMHDSGFEVRHEENLREHYAATLREWGANLERNWTQAVAEVGVRRARTWRLYMAAARIGFETNRIQVHQMLGVRTGDRGGSNMPPRPLFPRSSTLARTCGPEPELAGAHAGSAGAGGAVASPSEAGVAP
jgi:cyclopropane-fatty-acyl-phospholipid synthase